MKIKYDTEISIDSVRLNFDRGSIFINEEFMTHVSSYNDSNKTYEKVMKFSRKEKKLRVLKKMNNDTIFLVLKDASINQINDDY